MPTHITVTAPEGRKTPIHPNDGTDPDSPTLLFVEAGHVAKVRYSSDIRRSINRGDLIPCDLEGHTVDVAKAEAPEEFDGGRITSDAIAANAKVRADHARDEHEKRIAKERADAEIEAANRKHRQAPPDARPPLPDGTGPQTDRRRNLPAPSPFTPIPGPPPTTTIPEEDEPLTASAVDEGPHTLTTTDASRGPSFDTSDAGAKPGKGR